MSELINGDRVHVDEGVRGVVICDYLDRIAGKDAFVKELDLDEDEAFVVRDLKDELGTFVPLEFLSKVG
ncbi:hypothetical protein ACTXL6_20575 [Brachybacterium tyrofermentans]|uniref:hypothetical protein n=1 Tax=Brachybacterium tyrofermentans TaxID=47848 RepID=UPI003FD38704